MTESVTRVMSIEQSQIPEYRRAIDDELRDADMVADADLAAIRINHPAILGYKAKLLGGFDSYDEYADWSRFLLPAYGVRRSCLSIGSGHGRVEKYLIKAGFATGFESIELSPHANQLASAGSPGMRPREGDLNFIDLPKSKFDFVLCHGVLHHLINLEHLLWQIHESLTENGICLIYEYVGEDRWQFAPSRMQRLREWLPDVPLNVPPVWSIRGFESIRSADLLALIREQFEGGVEREVGYGGVYFPFIICSNKQYDRRMPEVLALDNAARLGGLVEPCYFMGVYRRTTPRRVGVRSWSGEELKGRLAPTVPLSDQFMRLAKDTPAWRGLRRMKRRLLGHSR